MFVEMIARTQMAAKGYTPPVIEALLPSGVETLQGMAEVDKATFGRYESGAGGASATNSAAFNEGYGAIKNLARTNVTFAQGMAQRYKSDPKAYRDTLDSLSNQMIREPQMSKKVAELARSGDGAQMLKLYDDFERDPAATIDAAMGRTPPAPAVAAAQGAPAAASTRRDRYDYESARKRFDEMMANKDNKLAKAIRDKKAEGDIDGLLKKDPNLVKKFDVPANADMYRAALEKDDKQAFLQSFSGEALEQKVAQAGMGGSGMAEGIGGIVNFLKDLFGGMMGGSSHRSGPPSRFDTSLGKIFNGLFGAMGLGHLGGGGRVSEILAANPAAREQYVRDQAAFARQAGDITDPKLRGQALAFAEKSMGQHGGIKKEDAQLIAAGKMGIVSVGIVEQPITENDPRTGKPKVVGTKRVPSSVLQEYPSIQELARARTDRPANDPTTQAPPKVAGSDITDEDLRNGAVARPVRPASPIESRNTMDPRPTPPTSGGE